MMRYLSLFSGIEAASAAWLPLNWKPVAFAEIDKFASAVLRHHYPDVPNWGDCTKFKEWPDATVDVVVGGSPCQAFSVAGLRKGMDDPRGNLALVFLAIVDRYRPQWIVYENVPGLRSADEGTAFGAFLGGLAELGYGLCWRSFDAQYAGLAQRRERVFVVGHLGDWRPAAAVLLEPEGLRWDTPPRREARERPPTPTEIGPGNSCAVSGCGRPAEKREWCNAHYQRWRASGDAGSTPINGRGRGRERFWEKIDRSGACWIYTGSLNENGYGIFWNGERTVRAHRFAFEDQVGPIPSGLQLDHICRNRACCNPSHLEPVTSGENTRRGNAGKWDRNRLADTADSLIPTVANPLTHRMHRGVNTTIDAGQPHAVAYGLRSDASREGVAKTPSPDAEGRVRLRDPGFNVYEEMAPTIDAGQPHAVAFAQNTRNEVRLFNGDGAIAGALGSETGMKQQTYVALADPISANEGRTYTHEGKNNFRLHNVVQQAWAVRRLTPRECERLQGFPDDFTRIPWRCKPAEQCPDGPRYKALGNSIAVPELRWIGSRIMLCEEAVRALQEADAA